MGEPVLPRLTIFSPEEGPLQALAPPLGYPGCRRRPGSLKAPPKDHEKPLERLSILEHTPRQTVSVAYTRNS